MSVSEAEALRSLAGFRGVELRHWDGLDREVEPTPEVLAAVVSALEGSPLEVPDAPERLRAARAEAESRLIEPVSVAWGEAAPLLRGGPSLSAGERVDLRLEGADGHRLEARAEAGSDGIRINEVVPKGYYTVDITIPGGTTGTATLIVAPEQAYGLEGHSVSDPGKADSGGTGGTALGRDWGAFLPLYALRTQRSRGLADLTDLGALVEWVGRRGGAVVGTLPLMAAYLDRPSDPSPYSPASRLFWNEAYLDPTGVPEWSVAPEARHLWESDSFRRRVERAREAPEVDYQEASRMQTAVLQVLADAWAERGGERDDTFASFLGANPEARAYAAFRATVEARGETWERWPESWRHVGIPPDAYDERDRRRHLYAQYRFPGQLARAATAAGGEGGLYLDLPLGPHPGGYDPWAHRELFATGAAMGAPPDAFQSEGQSWGLPPIRPQAARAEGHRHLRAILANLLPPSRYLRIDHVMALHRLYWVPDGMSAAQGAYVRSPAEEAYAVLCLESHRHQTVIVGEDLGTVPEEVRSEMDRRGLRRMYIVPFEIDEEADDGLAPVPPGAVAGLNTHDLPTFAAEWRDGDGTLRRSLRIAAGVGDPSETGTHVHPSAAASDPSRSGQEALAGDEASEAGKEADELRVLQGVLRWLGRGPAGLVLVNLEDLWLEERPQNVPGTSDPGNWRRKARLSLAEISSDPRILACLEALGDARRPASPSA